MNDLRETLHRLVDDVPVAEPPLEAMMRAPHPHRWVAPVAAAAAVVVVVAGGVFLGSGDREADRAPDEPTTPAPAIRDWQRLPDMPLSPRSDALSAYVDGQVVVVGGSDAEWAGGRPQHWRLRDGAAYDIESGEWHEIATAPRSLETWAYTFAVSGDQLLVPIQTGPSWLVYDLSDDGWRKVPAPAGGIQQPTLAVDGDDVYVLDQHVKDETVPIQILDLATDTWRELSLSTEQPTLSDRAVLIADDRVVVMGGELHPLQKDDWQRTRADVWDGQRWTRHVSPHQVRGAGWHWTGERVITMYRSRKVDYQRGPLSGWIPAAFDPATGEWGRIPWRGREPRAILDAFTGAGPLTLTHAGLYDDRIRTTTPITRPPGGWFSSGVVMTDNDIVVVGGSRPVGEPRVASRIFEVEHTDQAWIRALPE